MSNTNEYHVLLANNSQSRSRLRSTLAGLGKYGSGNKRKPEVTKSQTASKVMAAAKIGNMCPIHRRTACEKDWAIPPRSAKAATAARKIRYEVVSGSGSFFLTAK